MSAFSQIVVLVIVGHFVELEAGWCQNVHKETGVPEIGDLN